MIRFGPGAEPEIEQKSRYRNYRTQVSEPITVTGVERGYVGDGVWGIESGPDLARDAGNNSPVRIDGGGHSGVGVAQQPAVIFDSAHAGLFQVLGVGPAVTIPTIIRDVHENFGAIGGQLPDFVGKDRLIADEDAELVAGP